MKITVVGQENALQRTLLRNVTEAIHELQLECQLDVIHEMQDICCLEEQQLVLTPAVIANNHILCEGHIWEKEHIKHFLQKVCQEEENGRIGH
jgi:hypothetical protein